VTIRRAILFTALASVAALLMIPFRVPAQLSGISKAKGFRWAPEYYPASNGVQRYKTMITGAEGLFAGNGIILVSFPRIESYKEDGSLEWVATSVDATVDMFSKIASGTNVVAYRTGDTNFYVTGRGFQWHQTNGTIILSNQTYTWINRAAVTNSPLK
jgi:hypothetical protein